MFKTTFHREFVNPGGNTEEHMFHHNLARTHHPRGYYKMTHTGNWIDRSSWFAIQVGVGAEATPTTVATHLHACFEEAMRLKYVHSAPHFDMPQWSVPRLDGFFNVERAEFWKVSAAWHASTVAETRGHGRQKTARSALFDRDSDISSFKASDIHLCGKLVTDSIEIRFKYDRIIAWDKTTNNVFVIRNVGRGDMSAFRDVCAWAKDAAYAGRLEELKESVEKYGIAIVAQQQDSKGLTPLHHACTTLKVDVVRYLLRLGLDPNALSDDGLSPLLCALKTPTSSLPPASSKTTALEEEKKKKKKKKDCGIEARRREIAKALIAAGAKASVDSWTIHCALRRERKRLDTSRVALVGSTWEWLSLSFRLRRRDDGSAFFNEDIVGEIASFFFLPDGGLCRHLWHQFTDGCRWHCTREMKMKAMLSVEKLIEDWRGSPAPAASTDDTAGGDSTGMLRGVGFKPRAFVRRCPAKVHHGDTCECQGKFVPTATNPDVIADQKLSRSSKRCNQYRLVGCGGSGDDSPLPLAILEAAASATEVISNSGNSVRRPIDKSVPVGDRDCRYAMGPKTLLLLGL